MYSFFPLGLTYRILLRTKQAEGVEMRSNSSLSSSGYVGGRMLFCRRCEDVLECVTRTFVLQAFRLRLFLMHARDVNNGKHFSHLKCWKEIKNISSMAFRNNYETSASPLCNLQAAKNEIIRVACYRTHKLPTRHKTNYFIRMDILRAIALSLGARGSIVVKALLQTGRPRVRESLKWIHFF
jgi:hypothetical protein